MQNLNNSYLWGVPYTHSPLISIPEEDDPFELIRVPAITKEDVVEDEPKPGENMVNY